MVKMCGIVGAVAERDVVAILLEGLRRLEYRGYDSAGIATSSQHGLQRVRANGKISALAEKLSKQSSEEKITGHTGIAHTRWATHGIPSEENAHPHTCRNSIAIVHNGIIENHEELREVQTKSGYSFSSQTDTEVIVNQIHHHLELGKELLTAVQSAVAELKGAFALGVISKDQPDKLIAVRCGSPLAIGVGIGEYFIASDVSALLPVTQRFIFLEEGDVAQLQRDSLEIYDKEGNNAERNIKESELTAESIELGEYRHHMQKEIYEQPQAIADTLEGAIYNGKVVKEVFGHKAAEVFAKTEQVLILACGTSYHAGLTARYWIESMAKIPCSVEVASEFRYRNPVIRANTLVVTISQSGETADTLAALKEIKQSDMAKSGKLAGNLVICNVAESSLVRESELVFLTRAGVEIGVASTKAFTTQLVALMLLVLVLRDQQGDDEKVVKQLLHLPSEIEELLKLDNSIEKLSEKFIHKHNALFLGRGAMYPIAMEGALKLKELSYIHAEAYPAGELKHGPLALIDDEMPIVTVAPNDQLLQKLVSNLEEVKARGGELYLITDHDLELIKDHKLQTITIESSSQITAPILFTIPLQLLAYHVALHKGTDVDHPRNLAKAVTVE